MICPWYFHDISMISSSKIMKKPPWKTRIFPHFPGISPEIHGKNRDFPRSPRSSDADSPRLVDPGIQAAKIHRMVFGWFFSWRFWWWDNPIICMKNHPKSWDNPIIMKNQMNGKIMGQSYNWLLLMVFFNPGYWFWCFRFIGMIFIGSHGSTCSFQTGFFCYIKSSIYIYEGLCGC